MGKLDFVCVGPQRTGTSWLDKMLRNHPDICLPKNVKETRFFETNDLENIKTYFYYFRDSKPSDLIGEIAPTYFDIPETATKISVINSQCKIIICLREPVERAFSLYLHHFAKGRVRGGFREAIEQEPRILESGRYCKYVSFWKDKFDKNIFLMPMNKVASEPQKVLDELCTFLGVSPLPWNDEATQKVGASTYPKYPGLARITARLVTFFRKNNFHFVPEIGKRLGLKKIYTGGENSMLEPSDQDVLFLQEYYKKDIEFFNSQT